MKYLCFTLIGILFGIVMTKSEAVSWYRIQEMFRFDSFHMYGIIGTAVVVGVLGTALLKRLRARTTQGDPIAFEPKEPGYVRYLGGGAIFGLGWALTGACPGPLYVLFGQGYTVILVTIVSALLGTLVYGMVRGKLPH